ncbi:MAG: bifunctional phosphopantothenoylcysteine decarboxylase/phosphopantothenate--cysteine ligase CoaBC [Chlorobi bacterium]|nr:bifunctional phosphopantothenoylcysteine decarboxylase/phosphopantothenate--cysteine ligase CoaBC [Chlorobiota bacterium]MBX7216792.1 bifunctional phosphopantothenoylcysteine decarboxylase/phosphopantothenate--cysteine ligase CoaBC [Candidatus Kapabacteria bacterium]
MIGKNIIIGVTGSIAAYKAAVLARELVGRGTTIRVAMTPAASHFIAPLTFASLAKYPVALNMFPAPGTEPASGSWHIDWGLWADAMVIAPATASTIAKLAAGISDNALTVIATALRGKLFVAPAMDTDMYQYPALHRNLETLRSFGVEVIPVGEGELASGLTGPGRMAEPTEIADHIAAYFARSSSLQSRRVLITAGPTHEPIDPVRFIANHSSGKMGYALAEEARDRGAHVTLISGPTSLPQPVGVDVVHVITADQMAVAVDACSDDADIIIAAAAVADFTPTQTAQQKLKRRQMSEAEMQIQLRPTRDILRSVGERKHAAQVLVGFALETEGLIESAQAKLVEKNCDLVVANPATEANAGFGADTNRITIVGRGTQQPLPMMSKRQCAAAILDAATELLPARSTTGAATP